MSVSTVAGAPGSNVLVCPIYSTLDASANASLELLQQESVTMAYDTLYSIALNDVSSGHILNAFQLSGDGSSLAVAMRSGADADFKAMVKFVVDNATAAGDSLQTVLYNTVKNEISSVYGDAIANILESNWKLDVYVKSTDGAANLYGDLAAESSQRLLMAEQIPNATWNLYKVGGSGDDKENTTTDALALASGDKIVFLFDVTAVAQTRIVTAVQGGATANGNSASDPTPGGAAAASASDANSGPDAAVPNSNNDPALSNSMFTSRHIAAFEITVGADNAAGAKIASLAAASNVETSLIGAPQSGATGQAPQTGVDAAANA